MTLSYFVVLRSLNVIIANLYLQCAIIYFVLGCK